MAEKVKDTKEKVAVGTDKTVAAKAEAPVVAAPVKDKPEKPGAEAPKEMAGAGAPEEIAGEDIDDLIMLLNEIDTAFDGKGGIESIPPELKGVVKTMIDQMVGFREAFEDPTFKDILDDLMDQRTDGKTPSVLVAIARTIPHEELMKLSEGGDEGAVQEAVTARLESDKLKVGEDETLNTNIEGSIQALEEYSTSQGYDDAEKAELHSTVKLLMDIFADGKITTEEFNKIDKMRSYDADTEELRAQIPAEATKTVLPDAASMAASMSESKPTPSAKPRNSIESMASQYPATDVTDVGRRKRSPQGARM